MSVTHNFINIPDQKGDMKTLAEQIRITNIGIEAITRMYDDHRPDKNVSTKLFSLQESLIYRLFASFHQYELLVAGMKEKSSLDLDLHPFNGPFDTHPTIYRYSVELSSIVDSIFFHLCSVFDYFGHFISYLFEQNKNKTMDWGSLANKARANYKQTLISARAIHEIDSEIRKKLEEYRSQLIHHKCDARFIGIKKNEQANSLSLIFSATPETMKFFKNIVQSYDSSSKYTLDCLPSAVFYRTLRSINHVIGFLRADLLNGSMFEENVKKPKGIEPQYLVHPKSKKIFPKSEVIWADYQQQLGKFYQDLQGPTNAFRDRVY
jgi:hypothetical protein